MLLHASATLMLIIHDAIVDTPRYHAMMLFRHYAG